jgi:P4 family phage/plasmid primase-like protien
MIQILGLRSFEKNGELITYDAFHDKGWGAPSVFELFRDLPKYLEQIPVEHRWNLYYTAANCNADKRDFSSQSIIAFDIDHIDQTQVEKTVDVVLSVLKTPKEYTGVVSSGYGLHFIIPLENKIRSKDFFVQHKHHYRAVCEKIGLALDAAGLSGKPDTSIFEPRRILRLPGTVNRKPSREDKPCVILTGLTKSLTFKLDSELSGIPDVKAGAQISKNYLKRYPKVDTQAILDGCVFLKEAKDSAAEMTEPQWYAALSIVGRLEKGNELAHEFSRGHPDYSPPATEKKLAQAMEASGPRTCDNINDVWGKCTSCPHFGQVKSPIMIRGEGSIATEGTGFYRVSFKKDGEIKLTPAYEDLIKLFGQKHAFITLGGSRMVYTWNGTHYQPIENATIEAFAYEHFDPKPEMYMVREFRDRVCISNQQEMDWFTRTTEHKINFKNGVLDIHSKNFMPHSAALGFRYVLGFDFDPYATCPNFDAMLERITHSNPEAIALLNEAGGFAVMGGRYHPHKAIVLVGDGANGKTTWINTICAVAGRGNYSSLTLLDIQQSEYNRQLIDGKLFNISEETSVRSFADSSMFKRLVGGGVIQVRKPYKDPYEIQNTAKIIITCNELPASYDSTHGFARRLIVIPFARKFTKNDKDYDPNIEDKINEELPGVFNRLFAAYLTLKKNNSFTECKLADDKLEEYKDEIDTVRNWAKENVAYFHNGSMHTKFITLPDMYSAYKTRVEMGGERAVTAKVFGKRIKTLLKDYEERYTIRRIDGKVYRGFWGIDVYDGAGLEVSNNIETNSPLAGQG